MQPAAGSSWDRERWQGTAPRRWAVPVCLWKKGLGGCILFPTSPADAAMSLSSDTANIRELTSLLRGPTVAAVSK